MASFRKIQEIEINNLEELADYIFQLRTQFTPRTILLLEGPVGAGKTEMVKILTRQLGLTEVSSPSFAIHNYYRNNQGQELDHVDLYRLQNEDDLESTGFWDLFARDKGLVVIEWSNLLNESYLPLGWKILKIKIQIISVSERHLELFEYIN